jgi:hypothetical protein
MCLAFGGALRGKKYLVSGILYLAGGLENLGFWFWMNIITKLPTRLQRLAPMGGASCSYFYRAKYLFIFCNNHNNTALCFFSKSPFKTITYQTLKITPKKYKPVSSEAWRKKGCFL